MFSIVNKFLTYCNIICIVGITCCISTGTAFTAFINETLCLNCVFSCFARSIIKRIYLRFKTYITIDYKRAGIFFDINVKITSAVIIISIASNTGCCKSSSSCFIFNNITVNTC